MKQKTTFGGERLGSGSKMEVQERHFERSNHDLTETLLTTAAPGTIIPFYGNYMTPGDDFDIELYLDAMTHPTLGPMFNGFKIQADMFKTPIALYNAHVTMNQIDLGKNMSQVKIPQIEIEGRRVKEYRGLDNQHINGSCVWSYMGIRGLGNDGGSTSTATEIKRQYGAIEWLIYWDSVKNYYANKQEKIGYVIHNDLTPNDYTSVTANYYNMFGGLALAESPTIGVQTPIWFDPTSRMVMDFVGLTKLTPEDVFISWGNNFRKATSIWQTIDIDMEAQRVTFSNPRNFGGTAPWFEIYTGFFTIRQSFENLNDTMPQLHEYPLENIDRMRRYIIARIDQQATVVFDKTNIQTIGKPYNLIFHQTPDTLDGSYIYSKESSQEGLAVKTYQSDLFQNWLDTEAIDGDNGVNEVTAIHVVDDKIQVDQINVAMKVYRMLNAVNIAGGTTLDWQRAVYGVEMYNRITNPIYVGSIIKELHFQEVTSTAQSANGQPLGTIGGKGFVSSKHKGGNINVKADELSMLTGYVSITPRIVYSQGNKWYTNLKTWDDFHKPDLDQIGFQDLITDQMAWWDTEIDPDTGKVTYKSAGKQPAWINYTTSVNRALGNFAHESAEMFMTNNRRYEPSILREDGKTTVEIKDLTTYIDPAKYNYIWAYGALDAQNFWLQITTKVFARRKMSAKQIPNL